MKVKMKTTGLAATALFATLLVAVPAQADSSDPTSVQVNEVLVNQHSNTEKATGLWDQTREKTGAAASAAAEYSRVQGTRALEASKEGISKGTAVVVTESKEAWETTKDISSRIVDYSADKAQQVTKAVTEKINPAPQDPQVLERGSVETQNN